MTRSRPAAGAGAGRRRTKIVATIGPASESPETLRQLIEAGVDVCRLGLAHDDLPVHLERIERIRRAAATVGKPVAVLADLPGPKLRVAPFPDGGVILVEGDGVVLAVGDRGSTAERIEVDYDALGDDLAPGDRVALGDGIITLRVSGRVAGGWEAEVLTAGRAEGRPGFHLPSNRSRLATPTPEDLALIEGLAPAEPEILAVSFVRQGADVEAVRRAAGASSPAAERPGGRADGPVLVAKVETRAAVDNLPGILESADAVMVARGDLGIDCAPEEVPHLQKRIIRACVEWAVPVITATQMLESMVHSAVPTRAEASDVANAVFDGTDAVMLSGETAIGHDPVLAVRTMARIVALAEEHADYLGWGSRLGRLQRHGSLPEDLAITAATTHAAWEAAVELGAAAVVCCTRSGLTARAMARFRPRCPIVGCSPDPAVVRRMALSWGVTPMLLAGGVDGDMATDEMVWLGVERAVQGGFAATGDTVVVVAGSAASDGARVSDVLRIVRVR